MKIIEAAAAPYDEAEPIFPSALALMARRENPPARNIAIPCTTEPQYKVQRRPNAIQSEHTNERCELEDQS
jgi:hypothetical protein